jgi:hypothetical protein
VRVCLTLKLVCEQRIPKEEKKIKFPICLQVAKHLLKQYAAEDT